jgi:hypothetical protein
VINGEAVFREVLTPIDDHGLVRLEVPDEPAVSVAFITDPGPGGRTEKDWAWWRELEFVFVKGDIELDLSTILDPALRRIWSRRNPIVGADSNP